MSDHERESSPRLPGDVNVEHLITRAYSPDPIDPDFKEKVMSEMEQMARGRALRSRESEGSWGIRHPRLGLAVAALVLFAVGFMVFQPTREPDASGDQGLKLSHFVTARPAVPPPEIELAQAGDVVETAKGERRHVRLKDGSRLLLNEETSVRIEDLRKVTLRQGEIFVEVAPRAESAPGATFFVQGPDRAVRALGTKFGVTVKDDKTGALVTQGKVEMDGISRPLQAGEQVPTGERRIVAAPRSSHLLQWAREMITSAESRLVPLSTYTGGALIAKGTGGEELRLELRKYHIEVHIEDGFARTTIDQTYFNGHPRRMEGTFYFPLPADASLSRLAMYVAGERMEGGMVERDRGRAIYQQIVDSQKDPALLEWVDGSTFRMRVFPLEGREEKRIILSYTQRLSSLYGRTTYRFPAGHSLGDVKKWSFKATVKNGKDLLCDSQLSLSREVEQTDLILTAAEDKHRFDRDVVLNLLRPRSSREEPRFSTTRHEGDRYLMLRFRPELPGQSRAPRRDWVVLFESSAERNPVLARAQIEILRTFLSHVGHESTVSVLAVNHRVTPITSHPVTATPAHINSIVARLEKAHLIGALDLSKALDAAVPLLKEAKNPHLLHLGSGLTRLGERDPKKLLAKLSGGTPYIGVGVGKQWGRSWMKQAAEATGGYVTRINPDEPIAWRAFDLFATLGAPRLLNAKLLDKSKKLEFLSYTSIVAQGEEFCAIARTDAIPREWPKTLEVQGSVSGKPYRQEVALKDISEGADYLPRTWARLEIERLLRIGANHNKQRIIRLSKSMYVMTPFTSLLVLETEAMYQQFKVDRGRKDHWALYDCPQTIPVVREPLPGEEKKKPLSDRVWQQKPPVDQVLKSVLARGWPYFTGGPRAIPLSTLTMAPYEDHLAVAYHEEVTKKALADLKVSGGDRWALTTPNTTLRIFRRGGRFSNDINGELDFFSAQPLGNATRRFATVGGQLRLDLGERGETSGESLAAIRELTETDGQPALGALSMGRMVRPTSEIRRSEGSLLRGARLAQMRQARCGLFLSLIQDSQQVPLWIVTSPNLPLDNLVAKEGRVLYRRPQMHAAQNYLRDLLLHAPGLNTSWSDMQSIVEREAKIAEPLARGRIDPKAQALIESSQPDSWQAIAIPAQGLQQGFTLYLRSNGEFRYERLLTSGLKEIVICNGERLWHLYPEIGLGSVREMSRYHRSELNLLVPWHLPPLRDLATGADVSLIDSHTVAIVPHRGSVEQRLVYRGGRLVERQLVYRGKQELVLAKQTFTNGNVITRGEDGEILRESRYAIRPLESVDLTVESGGLVVLPMPFRARGQVLSRFKLGSSPSYPRLAEDEALALLASSVAERSGEAPKLITQRFLARGDRRLGFLTLLIASSHSPESVGLAETGQDGAKLESYLQHFRIERLKAKEEAKGPVRHDFFSQMEAIFRLIDLSSSQSREVRTSGEEDRLVAHVRECRSPVLLWMIVERYALQEKQGSTLSHGGGRFREKVLRAASEGLRSVPDLGYASRYELGCFLFVHGKAEEARAIFRGLFQSVVKAQRLPALDAYFRKALDAAPATETGWKQLIESTAQELLRDHRYDQLILLAELCGVVGDLALGDSLLKRASFKSDPVKHREQLLKVVRSLEGQHRYASAEKVIEDMVSHPLLAEDAELWRRASKLAAQRKETTRSMEHLEKALELEWRKPPEKIDLKQWQEEHSRILEHYVRLAQSARDLGQAPPEGLSERVSRLVERWRKRPVGSEPLERVARAFRLLGEKEKAWDYLTTWKGNGEATSAVWAQLAASLQAERQFELADRAFQEAFALNSDNAHLLWQRVENWQKAGKPSSAQNALRELANGEWRDSHGRELQSQARRLLGDR